MSYLIDDVARTLASPMPRRKALASVARLLAGTAAMTLFPRGAFAATTCGTSNPVVTSPNNPSGAPACNGGTPNAALIAIFNGDSATACPSDCSTRSTSNFSCTQSGACGNGSNACTVTATVVCKAADGHRCTTGSDCTSTICSTCPAPGGGGAICVPSGNKCCKNATTATAVDGQSCASTNTCCCGSTASCAVSAGNTCNGPGHSGCWSI